jgi:hypothetical protein
MPAATYMDKNTNMMQFLAGLLCNTEYKQHSTIMSLLAQNTNHMHMPVIHCLQAIYAHSLPALCILLVTEVTVFFAHCYCILSIAWQRRPQNGQVCSSSSSSKHMSTYINHSPSLK